MKLYLVRHGQSEGNLTHIFQGPEENLTALGKKQAEFLAHRFESIPVDYILASPYIRAQQTAEYISAVKKIPITHNPLLVEKKWGSVLTGKSRDNPEIQKVKDLLIEKELSDPEFRDTTEERFIDVRARAVAFLNFAVTLNQTYNNIAVISHGHFLRVLFATIIHGPEVPAKLFRDLFNTTSMHNTGITVADYDGKNWHIVTLNDHAHLGDYHRQNI